jgi:hypothetical protein
MDTISVLDKYEQGIKNCLGIWKLKISIIDIWFQIKNNCTDLYNVYFFTLDEKNDHILFW